MKVCFWCRVAFPDLCAEHRNDEERTSQPHYLLYLMGWWNNR